MCYNLYETCQKIPKIFESFWQIFDIKNYVLIWLKKISKCCVQKWTSSKKLEKKYHKRSLDNNISKKASKVYFIWNKKHIQDETYSINNPLRSKSQVSPFKFFTQIKVIQKLLTAVLKGLNYKIIPLGLKFN